jgi:hypothetical protein
MRAYQLPLAILTLLVASCVSDSYRYQHTWADAEFAPSARRLSRQDLEQIANIVSRPFPKRVLGIGRYRSNDPRDEINVVIQYGPDETYMYHLKKSNGRWHTLDEGRISVFLSSLPVGQ